MTRRAAAIWSLAALLFPTLASGCGLPGAVNEHERQVLVDYHFDQYAAVFAQFFPKQVTVHPGDTVVFKQSWSGEPHTVTLGTSVDEIFTPIWKYLKDAPPYPDTSQPPPADAAAAIQKLGSLPQAFSQGDPTAFGQQGAQPCYVDAGAAMPAPSDSQPCAVRTLNKAFNGKQLFYNSGVIPYQGDQGNTFRLNIAADATPGTHYYMCLIHGPFMSGAITIAPANQAIPSQSDLNTAAQKELSKTSDPMAAAFKKAQQGDFSKGYLAGVAVPTGINAELTEFVPKSVTVKAHQKVTWRIVGDFHTVSFDVPKYIPEITFAKDGTVSYTKETSQAVAGPGFPPPPPGDPTQGPPPAPVHIDAGDYDGGHFLSSGLGGPQIPEQEVTWSVTFTKPGTYHYACMVHPQMVGTVVVQ